MTPISTSNLKTFTLKRIALGVAQALLLVPSAFALPSNPDIAAGQVQIETSNTQMIIHQASQRAVLEYQQFNINANEKVAFVQPSSSALTLNKVMGPGASTIAGQLTANGHVYLVNPNGVFFSPSAQVDLTGLVVTTLNIDTEDFMAGDFTLMAPGPGDITNAANLHAHQLLAFVAPFIENSGTLSSQDLALISAEQLVITPEGQRTGFTVPRSALMSRDGGLINAGDLSGQWIALTAQSVDALHNSVIENSGNIAAQNLTDLLGGNVALTAQEVFNGGSINATSEQGVGGAIDIAATRIYNNGSIDVSGATGGGDIVLNAGTMLILDKLSQQRANAVIAGSGGRVINYSPGKTHFNSSANISATGGLLSGNGGFVEVSGIAYVEAFGSVNTLASSGETGTYLIDPTDITISNAADSGGAFSGLGPFNWTPSGNTSNISVATLLSNLGTSNVTINTGSAFAGTGNINVVDDIDINGLGTKSLSFIATNNVTFDAGAEIFDSVAGGDNLNFAVVVGGQFIMDATSAINLGGGSFSANIGSNASISAITTNNNTINAVDISSGGTISASLVGVNVTTPGTAMLSADNGIGALTTDLGAVTLTSSTGGASLTNNSSLVVNDINLATDGTLTSLGPALTISTLSAVNNLTLNASTAALSIPDAGLSTAGNFIFTIADIFDSDRNITLNSNNLTLNSGFTSGNLSIAGNFTSLDLTNSGANTLTLSDADSFLLNSFAVTGGGGLTLQTLGDFTIASAIDTDGNNGATLTFSSTGGDLWVNANIDDSNTVSTDSLALNLTALNNIYMTDGVVVSAYGGSINANTTNGDISVSSLYTTNSATTAIILNAGNRIIDAGDSHLDIRAVNGEAHLFANNGIIDLEVSVDNLTLANTLSGDISISEADSLLIDSLNAIADVSLTALAKIEFADAAITSVQNLTLNSVDLQLGNTGINNILGTLNITAQDIFDGDRSVLITAPNLIMNSALSGGDLTVTGNLNTLDLTISSNRALNISDSDAIALNQLTLAGGNFQLNAGGNITLANNIDTNNSSGSNLAFFTSLGDILVNASIDDSDTGVIDDVNVTLSAERDIIMQDGQRIHARAGTLNLTTLNGDILVSSLSSTLTTGTAINLNAGNRILDAGDTDRDINALGGRYALTAVNGIVDLEVRGIQADLINTGSGDISINELNNIDLRSLISANDTLLNAGGDITVLSGAITTVQTLTLNSTGDIIIPDTGIDNVFTAFIANALDIYDGDRIISINAPSINITNQLTNGNSQIDTTATQASINKVATTNQLTLNKTNTGNLFIANANTGTGDLALALLDGDLEVDSSGTGLATAGALNISANHIFDTPNDGVVTLRGSSIDVTLLESRTPLRINVVTPSLSLNGASTTPLTIRRVAGDLNFLSTSWNGDLSFEILTGNLILSDLGLSTPGNLRLTALDLFDSLDRNLTLNANLLHLDIANLSGGDLNLTGDWNNVALTSLGAAAFILNDLDDLIIDNIDLIGDGVITSVGNLTMVNAAIVQVNNMALTSAATLLLPSTGLSNILGSMSLTASDIHDGDRNLQMTAPSLIIDSSLSGGDLSIAGDWNSLSLTSTGSSTFTINDSSDLLLSHIDLVNNANINSVGNLSLANTALLNVNDLVLTSAATLILPSTGVGNVFGNLSLMANDIHDGDRSVQITAPSLLINSALSGGDIDFITNTNTLSLTSAARQVSFFHTGNAVLSIDNVGGAIVFQSNGNVDLQSYNADSLDLTVLGTLQLPLSGLGGANAFIRATDLVDADRQVSINSNQLLFNLSAPGANLILDSSAAFLDLTFAQNNLTVNSRPTGNATLADLDNDGYSVLLNNGNFTFNLEQGNLIIQNWLQASDASADGVRTGMLAFHLTAGNLNLVDGSRVSSLNSVDPTASGGLNNNDQTALLFRQLDQTDTSYAWTFGDASSNAAILLEAQGGDLIIDNFNGADLSAASRSLVLGDNVEVRAYNNLGDGQTGSLVNRLASSNTALLRAFTGRAITLLTQAATPTLPPAPPAPLDRPVDLDSLANDSTNAAEVLDAVGIEAELNTSVSQLLQQANGPCNSANNEKTNQKRCANQETINRFLNSLLIGGQLPAIKRETSL